MKRFASILLAVTITLILVALAGCGGSGSSTQEAQYSADLVARGDTLFHQTCFTCHGPDGKGIPNLGKDLTQSTSKICLPNGSPTEKTKIETNRVNIL